MIRILLVYPPFCTPAGPPYSITNLYGFLKNNIKNIDLKVLDLNAAFHKITYPTYLKYFQNLKRKFNHEEYAKYANEFIQHTKEVYSRNNKGVVSGKTPELFQKMLKNITSWKPDIVAFSIVYSSQAFYAFALLKELKKLNIKTIVGGPAINHKLTGAATKFIKNEIEFLEYIKGTMTPQEQIDFRTNLDYSIYNPKDYFAPQLVMPIKTTSTCYYQKCAFCSHHNSRMYYEFPLENIKDSLSVSNADVFGKKSRKKRTKNTNKAKKLVFIIDDMIHKKRILQIAEILKPLNVSWMCQLKPTNDFDLATLKKLKASGLKNIIWGIESGSQRVLDMMQKGTVVADIEEVLRNTKKAGIKNSAYIMFGFPTETKEEFLETIHFLEKNKAEIDLILTSVFGLQASTPVYNNPGMFSITQIHEEKRTILEPKIRYKVSKGLSQEEANTLRRKYKHTIENINKYPKQMNFFREHLLYVD
jgi:hypothetical protein